MKLALTALIVTTFAAPASRAFGDNPYTRAVADPTKTYAVTIDPSDATIGPADAKITIVEAYDYACPYCEKTRDTVAKLQAKYGADLRIIYKQMVVHPSTAMASALAACAAAKQNKFVELDALLWDNYKARSFDADDKTDPQNPIRCWETTGGCPIVTTAAQTARLNLGRFKTDMVACKANVTKAGADMATFGVSGIPTFFINGRILTGAQPIETFEKVIEEELALATSRIKKGAKAATYYQKWVVEKGLKALEKSTTVTPPANHDPYATQPPVPRPRRIEPTAGKIYAMPLDPGDASIGRADAKVTIVEAYDYACPYCERVRDTLTQLQAKYGKDLRIVFKQLVVHPRNAMASALAVCAANKQNKFAAMDALLWETFKARTLDVDDTTSDPTRSIPCWEAPNGCPTVTTAAQTAKLDLARFKTDMIACKANVARASADFATFGVSAIPGFFINGRFLSGAHPVENFAVIIDEELALATERIKKGTKPARYYEEWVVGKGLKAVEAP